MQAERLILTTDEHGQLTGLPANLPPNKTVELIVLVLDETQATKPARRPHPDIAGKMIIKGDIMSSVPLEDYELDL